MIEIKDILRRNNIKGLKYKRLGNSVVVDDKYIVKKNKKKDYILNYLDNRNFTYYPHIYDKDDNYEILEYIKDGNIPKEQKMNDLIKLVSVLHNKTTYYKEVDEADFKKLYEDILNNLEYLEEYYLDLISLIESKVFFSPPEHLLATNITLIFDSINYSRNMTYKWYEMISKKTHKMRVSVIHNNLSLDNYIKNNKDYLTNWDKSKIDIPIFDLYKLYIRNYSDFDFFDILNNYEKEYPLKDEELLLFYILISMPNKIEFDDTNYNLCIKIEKEVDKLLKSSDLISSYRKLPQTSK